MWCRVLIGRDGWDVFVFVQRGEKFLNPKRELTKFTRVSENGCAFFLNKGKEGGGKRGECIRGHGLGASHSECRRERGRGGELHPVTYQSLLFSSYLFCLFFFPLLYTCLHKLFFLFKLFIAQCESCVFLLWGARERGRWGLQTPNLSVCFGAVKVIAVTFHLLYNNCTVYACNSSVRCVFTTLSLCAPAAIFPAVWNVFSRQSGWWKSGFARLTRSDSHRPQLQKHLHNPISADLGEGVKKSFIISTQSVPSPVTWALKRSPVSQSVSQSVTHHRHNHCLSAQPQSRPASCLTIFCECGRGANRHEKGKLRLGWLNRFFSLWFLKGART